MTQDEVQTIVRSIDEIARTVQGAIPVHDFRASQAYHRILTISDSILNYLRERLEENESA